MIALIPPISETAAYLGAKPSEAQEGFAKILQAAQKQGSSSSPPPLPQYVVQAGDHLWGIAKKLGYADPRELARVNNLKDPDRLRVGQVLQLPAHGTSPGTTESASRQVASATLWPSDKATQVNGARRNQKWASAAPLSAATAPTTTQAAGNQGRTGVMVLASWYGDNHHGRLMANGQPFDMYGDTVAHPTLPLGTRLRLTNPQNGRSVVVEVTDRGPFVAGRGLDISYGVARKLGVVKTGVAPLVMETV